MRKDSPIESSEYRFVLKGCCLYHYPLVERKPSLKIIICRILSPFVYFWQWITRLSTKYS